jgi:hypothetical protein
MYGQGGFEKPSQSGIWSGSLEMYNVWPFFYFIRHSLNQDWDKEMSISTVLTKYFWYKNLTWIDG